MKKFLLVALIVFLTFPIFSIEDIEEYPEIDDFDAIFEDVSEDVVVEEAPVPTVVQEEPNSIMKITGSFSGKLGVACIYDDTKIDSVFTPGGLIDLSNTLNLSVNPSDFFGLYGSLSTAFSSKFTLDVPSLYFNSLLFDKIYISAGKKSISWGNLRIFSNTVLADSGSGISCEIRYPWKLGTITGVLLYDYNTYGVDASNFTWKNMSFAGAADITLLNTNINTFIRKYPEPASSSSQATADLLTGLELKRTLFGFDSYAQGTVLFKGDQYNITATGGFYKLWDGITPNLGINVEYQYAFKSKPEENKSPHSHFVNLEFGIKKIGPAQNMKGAVKWNHDFMNKSGVVDVVFIVSSWIPYADWTNGIKITYGGDRSTPKIDFGTALSYSLSY